MMKNLHHLLCSTLPSFKIKVLRPIQFHASFFSRILAHSWQTPCFHSHGSKSKFLELKSNWLTSFLKYWLVVLRKVRLNLWSHRFSQMRTKKMSGFLPCVVRAEILTIFCSYFGRNDVFINSFGNYLTIKRICLLAQIFSDGKDRNTNEQLYHIYIYIFSSDKVFTN